ncbi:uncharacterized protein LOC105026130 isoform X1 [Esox lucius]|uniref:uncharacterized protein LOC105026130 isoform X1 n=1 Tax=Esox lucius TaxID=8010 RepID=UPI001476EFAE|nr:uncharacterized protein LOC105026130 isoform X1 [Esox lucius]
MLQQMGSLAALMVLRLSLSVGLFLMDGGSYGYRHLSGPVDGCYGGVNSTCGSSSGQYRYVPGYQSEQPREQGEEASPQSEEAPELHSGIGIQQAYYDSYKPDDRFIIPPYKRSRGHDNIPKLNKTPVKMASQTIMAPNADRPSNGNIKNWVLRKSPPFVPELPEVVSNQHLPEMNRPPQLNSVSQTRWQRVKFGQPIPQYINNQRGQNKFPFVHEQQKHSSHQMLPKKTNRPSIPTLEDSINGNTPGDLVRVFAEVSFPQPTGNPQGQEETFSAVPEQTEQVSSSLKVSKRPTPVNGIQHDRWQLFKPSQTIPQSTGSYGLGMKFPSVPLQPGQIYRSQKLPETTKRPTVDYIPQAWWLIKPGQNIHQVTGSHGLGMKSPSVPEQPEQISRSQKLPETTKRPTPEDHTQQVWWKLVKPGQTITQTTGKQQGQGTKQELVPWIKPQKWVHNIKPQDLVHDIKKPQSDDTVRSVNPPIAPTSILPLPSIIQTHNRYERRRVVFSHTHYSPRDTAPMAKPLPKQPLLT